MDSVNFIPTEILLALAFMGTDVITGVIKAIKNKELNSTKAREGMYKKASFIVFIAFGYLADYSMSYIDMGINFPAAATICALVVVTEAISVLENLGAINPEIVKLVAPFLSALQDKQENQPK